MTIENGAVLKEIFSGMVPLKEIEVRGNARRAFDDEAMKELTENRMERSLSSACFPRDKEYAGEVSCAACPFNTGIDKKQLVDIALAVNGSEAAYRAIGVVESEDLPKTLGKLSEKDLLKLAWLSTVNYWDADKAFSSLGVDVKKSRKEARNLAMAEWEKAQKATKEKSSEAAGQKAQEQSESGKAPKAVKAS